MITIKNQNPLILYWLHTSGILGTITTSIEERFKCQIILDLMKIRVQGTTLTQEVIIAFNKQVEEQIASYKIECLENLPEETYSSIRQIFKQCSKNDLRLIDCQEQSKSIKTFLQANRLTSSLLQFQNYYELLNCTYIFVKEMISEQVFRMISKNDLNDSLNQEVVHYSKPDIKIEQMTLGLKIGEFQGGELWNCRHKNIPHTYIKFRDQYWQDSCKKKLLHYCHPNRYECNSLFPPIQPLKPSKNKLNQLLSFLKILQQKYPTHYPTCDSIFENEGKLVIFTRQNNYKLNKGWLCYHVMYGSISYQAYLRWIKHNPNNQISKYNEEAQEQYSMKII